MTNMTTALATRISELDGIHVAHATNRVALAITVAEAAAVVGAGLLTPVPAATVIEWASVSRSAAVLLLAEMGRDSLPSTSTMALAAEFAA